jgi:nucleoside-diphosphate-sugar epimerase
MSSAGFPPVPAHCVVTGSSGFVGQRLVEMLLERGAERIVALDIVEKPSDAVQSARVEYVRGSITDMAVVERCVTGADCVWHNAAAVGPYHPLQLYEDVNHVGTLNVIAACRRQLVRKCVMSSSPSTRFTGADIEGLREDELPSLPLASYLQEYAASKARGEMAMRAASCDDFLTVAVAPHQVYGPRDNLFLPNILEACGTGRWRVFGSGRNNICFTHVDNYCHGLIIAERALSKGGRACGQFYIVTDGDTHPHAEGYANFYDCIHEAALAMGFDDFKQKAALPLWLLWPAAYVSLFITWLTGIRLKLTPFTVLMLTMHRWFSISNAERDLHYKPIVSFKSEWPKTLVWFRENWLPVFRRDQARSKGAVAGLAKQTQDKIDIQAGKAAKKTD